MGAGMNYISLFAGIGGFDLGFKRAGMKCTGQAEIDKAASALLARQFPDVKNYGDVRNVRRDTIIEPIDLVCGGFPCQDVSIAGRRAGLAGERSGLWSEFARVIDEFEPRWVVIENVPGLLSSNRGRDFASIIQWLADRGYCVAWRVLDAQYFGLAQRRKRVFIVGSFGSGHTAHVLFEPESLSRYSAPGREAGQDIAHALTASATASGRLDPSGETFVTGTLAASGAGLFVEWIGRRIMQAERESA